MEIWICFAEIPTGFFFCRLLYSFGLNNGRLSYLELNRVHHMPITFFNKSLRNNSGKRHRGRSEPRYKFKHAQLFVTQRLCILFERKWSRSNLTFNHKASDLDIHSVILWDMPFHDDVDILRGPLWVLYDE